MNIFKQFRAIALCICLIILTACGSKLESVNDSGGINDGAQSGTSSAIQADGSETVTVLAKSNNTVSDKEKQEVLDQLSTEMDGLLNTINEVEAESIQDSELSF